MKRKLPLLALPLLLLAAVALLCQGHDPSGTAALEGSAQGKAPSAGMMLYVDPETGKFLQSPPPGSFPVEMSEEGAYSSSSLGLAETAAPVGGGKMVNLHGRFQQAFVAKVGASGKVTATCVPRESVGRAGAGSGKGGERP